MGQLRFHSTASYGGKQSSVAAIFGHVFLYMCLLAERITSSRVSRSVCFGMGMCLLRASCRKISSSKALRCSRLIEGLRNGEKPSKTCPTYPFNGIPVRSRTSSPEKCSQRAMCSSPSDVMFVFQERSRCVSCVNTESDDVSAWRLRSVSLLLLRMSVCRWCWLPLERACNPRSPN